MSSAFNRVVGVIHSALRQFGQILSQDRDRSETGDDDCVDGLHLGGAIVG